MKLHLPLSLRKSLLALFSVSCGMLTVSPIEAGQMHSDVSIITYTDFGQNKGRYVTGESVNALLQHIRDTEGGIAIHYTDGTTPYRISNEQGMISFAGTGDNGAYAAIAPNTTATVNHNGSNNASFGGRIVGGSHAISYSAIDIRYSSTFRLTAPNGYDYALQRQSKIITDALYNPLSSETDANAFLGQHLYHSGAGDMAMYVEGRGYTWMHGAYGYIIGGIDRIKEVWNGAGNHSVISSPNYGNGVGADSVNPLPNGIQQGDSGSPIFVYNKKTKQYEYISAQQSGYAEKGDGWSQARGNVQWTKDTLNSFNAHISMGAETDIVYLNAINAVGETKSDGTNSATLYSGQATDASGNVLTTYNGIQNGESTWKDLSGLKDTQNWYAYNSDSYLQKTDTELFFTNNLVFNATAEENTIYVQGEVDLGIGYAEFNGGSFTISKQPIPPVADGLLPVIPDGWENYRFSHAGYVINEGAEVHLRLTESADYMREWRKIGKGDLYIDGSGDTNALLNTGGSGTTYLQQQNGYAAYNVLANTGARVVVKDISQIARDFTFGAGGGTLDMNGNSMDWYTSNTDVSAEGFSINALTEEAVITNEGDTVSRLTFKTNGEQTYLGSFKDSATGALQIDYQGGGTWTLNSIHTDLTKHTDSGLTVSNGKVIFSGTNTVHGKGSESGTSANRLQRSNDWHYADAKMNVSIANGSTFELGSHARLTGDVTVENNGTFVMREGVAHAQEYVEGGTVLENTSLYKEYFGHKGNVQLNGGTFAVQYNDGVDTATEYSGKVSGSGNMTVHTGYDGGSLLYGGNVDASVKKTLLGGTLILTDEAAASSAAEWLVQDAGQMKYEQRHLVDSASTGTLVLSEDTASPVDMSRHAAMQLGALIGTTVQYGTEGTTERLSSLRLGGAGTLVVNYVLSGSDELTVDGRGHRVGEIQLRQIADDFSGTINVQSTGGRMVLNTGDNCALTNTVVNIRNGGVIKSGNLSVSGDKAFIELYGSMQYDTVSVENGATLNLRAGGRLDTEHAATIAQGGIMRLNTQTLQDKVELKNDGIMYGNGGTIGSTANVKATEAEGTGVLSAGGGTFKVEGQIGAATDATLRLENGTFNIYTGSINAAGGTLELACGTVNLGHHQYNYATQNIGGTLSIGSNVTIYATQGDPNRYRNITHQINHLHIQQGKTLTLVEGTNELSHVYHLASLTGQGEIIWRADQRWFNQLDYAGTSRLLLNDDNSFIGTLKVQDNDNHGSFQQVGLMHDYAARNMNISLTGDSGLAISTANAHITALGGTGGFVYAGSIKTGANTSAPTSTALNTLIIHTAGENEEHTFNGTLLGNSNCGLNLVKEGAGTQSFSNSANVLHDISALQGHLQFTAAPTIHGDVSIAQGAQLTIGSGAYSLDAGHTLRVLAGTNEESAVLDNALVLNGGELSFSAYNADGDASLSISGVSTGAHFGDSLNLRFSNMFAIQEGVSYLLASGDWSALNGKLTISERGYLNTNITADNSGLHAVFSMKDDYTVWSGDETMLKPDAKVVFGSAFGNQDSLNISSETTVDEGYFRNEGTFTIDSDNGSDLSFSKLEKNAAGELVVNIGVRADTMLVTDSAVISGDGKLTVGNLEINAGAVASITEHTLSIGTGGITGNGHLQLGQNATLEVQDSLSGNVILGADATESRINIAFTGNSLSIGNAAVTVKPDTTLSVSGSGSLMFHSGFNNLKALELQEGVNFNQSTALSTHLVLNGGHATLSGDRTVSGNITVNSGSVLTAGGNSDDTLVYSDSSGNYTRVLTINQGGELALGSRRWSMGNGTETDTLEESVYRIQLNGGTISGNGTGNGNLDFFDNGKIDVTGNTGSISAEILVRRSEDAVNVNVIGKNDSLTISGKIIGSGGITKDGLGTLHLNNANNSYTGTTTVNGGVLRAAVAGALSSSSLVINDGGEAYIGGSRTLRGDTTVNSGGTLTFTGTDAIQYGDDANYSKKLTVDGGTVDFGSTRQTMAKWELTLKNGAELTGEGGSYNNSAYRAALDFNQDSTITAEGTGNLISANIRLRDGNARTLTYHVAEDSDLEVSGRMHADTTGALGNVSKTGEGNMTISQQTGLSKLSVHAGELAIAYTGTDGNTLYLLDGSMGGNAGGTLRLAQDAKLTVANQIWGRKDSSIVLESGSELTSTQDSVVISNRRAGAEATLRTNTQTNDSEYAVNKGEWELTNAHIIAKSASASDLLNKLVNTSVENAGSGKLTVSNAANSITDVYASAGDMAIMQQAAGLNLEELVVAADKTVSAYTGANANAAEEADVTVRGHAEFGKGAVLNANLTLASGSSLSVAEGGLAMGSTLSLQKGITLDDTTLNRVYSLNTGESLALFTGVDGLKLGETSYASISADDGILASPYFTNLNSDQYRLTYTGTDNGTLAILSAAVPEPTSSMLGLMGLVAFTFRRRRK